MTDESSRRQFLRVGATTAVLGVGLSGCNSSGDGGGTATPTDGGSGGDPTATGTATATATETRTATATETPTETRTRTETETGDDTSAPSGDATGPGSSGSYTEWLFAPGTAGDVSHYQFTVLDFAAMRANQDGMGRAYRVLSSLLTQQVYEIGLEWEQVTGSVSMTGGPEGSAISVLLGSYSPDPVTEVLTSRSFEERRSYGGFTIYHRTSEPEQGNAYLGPAVAVGAGALLSTDSSVDPSDGIEGLQAAIDAANGDVQRYPAASDDFSVLSSALGTGLLLTGRTNEAYASTESGSNPHFAGQVASGQGLAVDGTDSTVTIPVVFESASAVDAEAVRSWVETRSNADSGQLAVAAERSVSTDGRVATVTATGPTERMFGGGGGGGGRVVAPNLGPLGGI